MGDTEYSLRTVDQLDESRSSSALLTNREPERGIGTLSTRASAQRHGRGGEKYSPGDEPGRSA
jgi:hypothetical protein